MYYRIRNRSLMNNQLLSDRNMLRPSLFLFYVKNLLAYKLIDANDAATPYKRPIKHTIFLNALLRSIRYLKNYVIIGILASLLISFTLFLLCYLLKAIGAINSNKEANYILNSIPMILRSKWVFFISFGMSFLFIFIVCTEKVLHRDITKTFISSQDLYILTLLGYVLVLYYLILSIDINGKIKYYNFIISLGLLSCLYLNLIIPNYQYENMIFSYIRIVSVLLLCILLVFTNYRRHNVTSLNNCSRYESKYKFNNLNFQSQSSSIYSDDNAAAFWVDNPIYDLSQSEEGGKILNKISANTNFNKLNNNNNLDTESGYLRELKTLNESQQESSYVAQSEAKNNNEAIQNLTDNKNRDIIPNSDDISITKSSRTNDFNNGLVSDGKLGLGEPKINAISKSQGTQTENLRNNPIYVNVEDEKSILSLQSKPKRVRFNEESIYMDMTQNNRVRNLQNTIGKTDGRSSSSADGNVNKESLQSESLKVPKKPDDIDATYDGLEFTNYPIFIPVISISQANDSYQSGYLNDNEHIYESIDEDEHIYESIDDIPKKTGIIDENSRKKQNSFFKRMGRFFKYLRSPFRTSDY